MYSVQCGFGVPKDLPQGSIHDGFPRRRITSVSDAPTCTALNRVSIREFRWQAHAMVNATSPTHATTKTAAFCLMGGGAPSREITS
jgi:hypothetical protein